MSAKRYTEEFKTAAVKRVAQRGDPASEVSSDSASAFIARMPGISLVTSGKEAWRLGLAGKLAGAGCNPN